MIRHIALVAMSIMLLVSTLHSDEVQRRNRHGRPSAVESTTLLDILSYEAAQREIEMTDEQVLKLNALLAEIRGAAADMSEVAKDLSGDEKAEFRQDAEAQLIQIEERRLPECILPHQLAALKRKLLRRRVHHEGISGLLRSGDLVDIESLKLSDAKIADLEDQTDLVHEDLRKELTRLHLEYAARIKKLEAIAWEKSLEPLTEDQRKRVQEMVGSDFRVDSQVIR